MNNQKQRNIYIMIGVVAVIMLGSALIFANKSSGPQANTGAAIMGAPTVNSVPGVSENKEYNKAIDAGNKVGSEEALKNNTSFVPVLSNSKSLSDQSALDQIERDRRLKEQEEEKARQEQDRLKAEQESIRQAEERARQQYTPATNMAPVNVVNNQPHVPAKREKYTDDDRLLIKTLTGVWNTKPSSSEFDFAREKVKEVASNTNTANSANNSQNTTAVTKDTSTPYAKAGAVFNAILETAINSDEPSPVLAKIISGPLKGTRLIGQIQTVGEKVVIEFSTANIPQLNNSVKLTAYAIDPNTSRTALADNVNNHYFLKYGVMLASSFLGGYADAIARQNTTTTVGPFGGTTVVQGELSSSDINKAALGSVGKTVSTDAKQHFNNIKPTITVNAGSAIGILLVNDLIIKN